MSRHNTHSARPSQHEEQSELPVKASHTVVRPTTLTLSHSLTMPVTYCAVLLLPTSTDTSTYLSVTWYVVVSLRPTITGVVPTLCLTTQLPSAMRGIILNNEERSASLPCRNLFVFE